VKEALGKLPLTAKQRSNAQRLVRLLNTEGRVSLATVIDELHSDINPDSAIRGVTRQINTLNEAARQARYDLTAVLTLADAAGSRWLQFEAPDLLLDPRPSRWDDLEALADNIEDRMAVGTGPTIGVLCFNDNEFDAIWRTFDVDRSSAASTISGVTYYRLGYHADALVVLRQSGQGQLNAQSAALHMWNTWHTRAIIACGIGFGVDPKTQQIGDVLIASDAIGYELQRLNEDGSVTPRGRSLPASGRLGEHLEAVRRDLLTNPAAPTLTFTTVLSGDKLIDSAEKRDALRQLYRAASAGGDMESFALAHAAQEIQQNAAFDWVAIQGISDFAERKNTHKQANQRKAAASAAMVLRRLVDRRPGLYAEAWPTLDTIPANQRAGSGVPMTAPHPYDRPSPDSVPARLDDLRDGVYQGALLDLIGQDTVIGKAPQVGTASRPTGGDNVNTVLWEWAADEQAPPLFVLLGEYGMGKTIAAQLLTRDLWEARAHDPLVRLPLYFDLRFVTGLDRHVPSVDEVFVECAQKGWDTVGEPIAAAQVWNWVRAGSVVIFDGLDEVLTRISPQDGQAFTSSLLSVVDSRQSARPPKVLVTARPQYFRSLEIEHNHLTGELRGNRGAERFKAMALLPLTEEQIVAYLQAVLSPGEARPVLDLITHTHDLGELSTRPITLRLLVEALPTLLRTLGSGEQIRAVDVYRTITRASLLRDTTKAALRLEDKLALLSELAGWMWHQKSTSLPAEQLESWFAQWVTVNRTRVWRYQKYDPEVLLQDLRNSTMLSRRDESTTEADFQFAHTSLFEYFLATHLFTAIEQDQPTWWDLPTPSDETLGFLGQLIHQATTAGSNRHHPAVLTTLSRWVRQDNPATNALILRYALYQQAHQGDPAPSLAGIHLAGVNLDGLQVTGRTPSLAGADFTGASLREAIFNDCDLRGAKLTKTDLWGAYVLDCDCSVASFDDAQLIGTRIRTTNLGGATFENSTRDDLQVIDCPVAPPGLASQPGVVLAPGERPVLDTVLALDAFVGHHSTVISVAWSPDGARLATAGSDGSARVWDAETAQPLATLSGNTRGVTSVARSTVG
jgi:nucleoside phosphorylase/uncharacterized protein YjbI with pentapeptide repeats